jgi:hypothetical protein
MAAVSAASIFPRFASASLPASLNTSPAGPMASWKLMASSTVLPTSTGASTRLKVLLYALVIVRLIRGSKGCCRFIKPEYTLVRRLGVAQTPPARCSLPVPIRWLNAGGDLPRPDHADQCADCPSMCFKRSPKCPLRPSDRVRTSSCHRQNGTISGRHCDEFLPVAVSTMIVPVMCGCKEQKYL